MNDERLVSIPDLTQLCTSAQAIAAVRELAAAEGATTGPWQVTTEDGLDSTGCSVRWEIRFDLPAHRQELVVTVGFPVEEGSGSRQQGVASLRRLPFPSEGSELARMARDGQISGRRLRAVWRQQVREHEPLPRDLPDSSAVAALVAPDAVRVARARITRMRGFVWIVTTPGQTRHLRMSAFE